MNVNDARRCDACGAPTEILLRDGAVSCCVSCYHAAHPVHGLCDICGETTTVRPRDYDVTNCDSCHVSGLAHGHAHGMHTDADGHDEFIAECPTCEKESRAC